ncbi:MAG TPA: hypothetical protein DG577_02840 [Firmicutes bacterium]|jgi:hypothetical protein|nr:hypothetical protein [Bacillota bacterium]
MKKRCALLALVAVIFSVLLAPIVVHAGEEDIPRIWVINSVIETDGEEASQINDPVVPNGEEDIPRIWVIN